MDCAEISRAFLTGVVPPGAQAREHLLGCAQCAALCEHEGQLGLRLASAAPTALYATQAQLAETESLILGERGVRAFLRSRSTRVRWGLSLGLPALLLTRELLRGRVPWQDLSSSRIIAGLVLLGFLGVVAWSALRPLPIERRAARLRSSLSVVAWCLPCVLWFVPAAQAGAGELSGGWVCRSFGCFVYGSALAAPSFALLWAFDRGIRVPYRVWALAAGLVALLANLILMLHCPLTNARHCWTGHFSIGLAWLAAVTATEWYMRRADT